MFKIVKRTIVLIPRSRSSQKCPLPTALTGLVVSGRCHSYMQLFHKLRLVHGPDPVESPRLTPNMVTSILRMNEKFTHATSGVVKEVQCNQIQANKPIEDRHAEGKLVGTDKYLFGLFDGHAGCACAQTLKDRLFQYLAVSLADLNTLNRLYEVGMPEVERLVEYLATSTTDGVSRDLAILHWQSLLHFINDSLDMYSMESSIKECMEKAFLRLDQDISMEASFHPGDQGLSADLVNIAFSGAVGCVAYIDGLDLYVANVGDSQAVVGSYSTESGTWLATNVSRKHDAENEDEVRRLFTKHPNEPNILRSGRLFGELMPLRAFGDVRYKWSKKELEELKKTAGLNVGSLLTGYKDINIPSNYRTPPYLDAKPEVMHYRLSPKDRFLILASDGLWDSDGMTVDKVVSLVGHHADGRQVLAHFRPAEGSTLKMINQQLLGRKQDLAKRSVDENVCTHLIRHSLGMDHGHVSAQLTLPEKLVRCYRDDITITVIYFDQDYILDYTRQH